MEATGLPPQNAPQSGEPVPGETPQAPPVPHADTPQSPEDVASLSEQLKNYRAEVARFREELQQRAPHVAAAVADVGKSEEQRLKERLEELADHSHYCPGCGRVADYPKDCTGTPAAPHPPIPVVSTDEIGGDPQQHTAAPATE